jgi:hypothetical protein
MGAAACKMQQLLDWPICDAPDGTLCKPIEGLTHIILAGLG